jgi:hypothetical protein
MEYSGKENKRHRITWLALLIVAFSVCIIAGWVSGLKDTPVPDMSALHWLIVASIVIVFAVSFVVLRLYESANLSTSRMLLILGLLFISSPFLRLGDWNGSNLLLVIVGAALAIQGAWQIYLVRRGSHGG